MPRVPYDPIPTVQPTGGSEQIRLDVPPEAFGVNIGRAMQHLGTTFGEVGNELWSRAEAFQQLNNEAEARDLQTQHAQETAPLVADFDATKGAQARDGLTTHLKKLQDIRDQLSAKASNPAVRRAFLNDTAGFMQRETIGAARHAGVEFKNYIVGDAEAQSKLTNIHWTDPEDQGEVDEKIATHHKNADTVAEARGYSPAQKALWIAGQDSETYAGQLEALGQIGKTEKAFELLDKYINEQKLTQQDFDTVRKQLWKRNEQLATEFLGKKIGKEMPDASPDQKMERLEELAPKYAHGDPAFLDAAKHHLRTILHLDNVAQEQNVRKNMQTLYGLIRNGNPDGTPIDSFAKLVATPEGKAAYDALPEGKVKNDMPKIVSQGVLARDFETNQAIMKELTGMAHDPAQRKDFLNINPFDPKYHLGLRDIDKILAWRKQAMREPMDEPLVRQGWNAMKQDPALRQTLYDLSVISKQTGKENPNRANQLRGGMVLAIQEFEAAEKRPPSKEEMMEKILKPLVREHAEPGTFGMLFGGRSVPQYATTFSKKDIEGATKDLTDAAEKTGGNPPSKNEVDAYLRRKYWKEQFQGTGGRSDEGFSKGNLGGGPNIPD